MELVHKFPLSMERLLKRAFKRSKYFRAVRKSALPEKDQELEVTEGGRSRLSKATAALYIEHFSWELSEEETARLNEKIARNNEKTVRDEIVENIQKNKSSMSLLQGNVENITSKVQQIKDFYEKDMKNLVHVINLLKDGQTTEANNILSQIKLAQ